MLPRISNYTVFPSVVPADKETLVTVAPTENSFIFFEGEVCSLTFVDVGGDEDFYLDPHSHRTVTAVAEGGVIRIKQTFEGEGEHLILLTRENAKNPEKLSLYSLYPDLYGKRPLRGDLHSHSYRSDGARDPAALAGHFREQGYSFFALTDHNRAYPGDEIDDRYKGSPVDFERVYGEEVHAPGSVVHIIHVGGRSSVAELYVNDPSKYEKEIEEYLTRTPDHVPERYRGRYARSAWACDKIHEAGGIAIFVHPFWKPDRSKCFNVTEEFARILMKSGMFDAYELLGGMGQEGINLSVALWNELQCEGVRLPVVGSSDVHTIEKSETFPHCFTLCFADDNSSEAIISAIKRANTVAVEASGYEYQTQYRAYGSLRLVTYAHFLLRCYFPHYTRICQSEGVAMRSYVRGEAPRELLELLAKESERFRAAFFGEIEAPVPSDEVKEFIEKSRDRQRRGPSGKGSLVNKGDARI